MTSKPRIVDQKLFGLGLGERFASGQRTNPLGVLALAAWFGLASGWLEVGMRVLYKSLFRTNRLYLTSRHFVWLVPLSNLLLFFIGGLVLAAATKVWPRLGGWLSPRVICAAAVMPALMVAGVQIHTWALVVLAAGISMREPMARAR